VGEVGAHHRRAGRHPGLQHVDVGQLVAAEDADPHGAALAQVAGERPGVDPAMPTTPCVSSSSSSVRRLRQLLGTRLGSRTT
jgi:hypothetical protein